MMEPLSKTLLLLLALIACSNETTKPSASAEPSTAPSATPPPSGGDPWGGQAAPPQQGADPWTTPSEPTAADPWKAEAAAAAPTAAEAKPPTHETAEPNTPRASADASTLAGKYECQQQRSSAVGGMLRSTFVASAMGMFEIDSDGSYRSASYASKGSGRVRANGKTVTFDGGAYAGSPGVTGTNSTGFYIRLSQDLTTPPDDTVRFSDHVCYRRR